MRVHLQIFSPAVFQSVELDASLPLQSQVGSTMNFPQGITKDAAVQFLSAKVDSNLTHVLQEADVPIELQYNLCQSFKTVRRFSTYEDERSKVREALTRSMGPPVWPTGLQWRQSSVLGRHVSSSLSRSRNSRRRPRVLGVPRPITQTDRAATRASFIALRTPWNHRMTIFQQRRKSSNPTSPVHRRSMKSPPSVVPELTIFLDISDAYRSI